jgi:ABC-type polysaccharide/polyol phosphate transport system ATPase subunit
MSQDIAVSIKNLSKSFKLYRSPVERLKELIHPLKKKYHRDFWALRDINIDIPKGTTFGIIGQNGSGKSTLLQLIAGILRPTTGSIQVDGRVSALLELGAGFSPGFTGRENVFMQGAIMGIGREEMERRFNQIVDFAGIGQFIDQPVKTYSSGMYVRLAFAVAINVDPDILIVDEALAVGDDMYKRRCYRKIEEFQKNGKTIIFVSHSLPVVTGICDQVMLLDGGEVVEVGEPGKIVNVYLEMLASREVKQSDVLERAETIGRRREGAGISAVTSPSEYRFGSRDAEIIDIKIIDKNGRNVEVLKSREEYTIRVSTLFKKDVQEPVVGFMIKTVYGMQIFGTSTELKNAIGPVKAGTVVMTDFSQKIYLNPGSYSLSVAVLEITSEQRISLDRRLDVMVFKVVGKPEAYGIVDMGAEVQITFSEKAQT